MKFISMLAGDRYVIDAEVAGAYTMVLIGRADATTVEKIIFQLFPLQGAGSGEPTSKEFLERAARIAIWHFEKRPPKFERVNLFGYEDHAPMFDGELIAV